MDTSAADRNLRAAQDPSLGGLLKRLGWDFGTLRIALAALLLFAALMKSEQLWASSPHPFASPTFALILFEFVFAAWLLTGWLPRLTWWLAVPCFTAFAFVAGVKALSGQSDCGCFGAVHLPPILALAIDLVALAALILCRSGVVGSNSTRPHFAGLVLLVALPALAQRWVSNESPLVQVAPGVRMSAEVAIVDPASGRPGRPSRCCRTSTSEKSSGLAIGRSFSCARAARVARLSPSNSPRLRRSRW